MKVYYPENDKTKLNSYIESINNFIQEHNKDSATFESKKKEAYEMILRNIPLDNISSINDYSSYLEFNDKKTTDEFSDVIQFIKKFDTEIVKNVDFQDVIEEINLILEKTKRSLQFMKYKLPINTNDITIMDDNDNGIKFRYIFLKLIEILNILLYGTIDYQNVFDLKRIKAKQKILPLFDDEKLVTNYSQYLGIALNKTPNKTRIIREKESEFSKFVEDIKKFDKTITKNSNGEEEIVDISNFKEVEEKVKELLQRTTELLDYVNNLTIETTDVAKAENAAKIKLSFQELFPKTINIFNGLLNDDIKIELDHPELSKDFLEKLESPTNKPTERDLINEEEIQIQIKKIKSGGILYLKIVYENEFNEAVNILKELKHKYETNENASFNFKIKELYRLSNDFKETYQVPNSSANTDLEFLTKMGANMSIIYKYKSKQQQPSPPLVGSKIINKLTTQCATCSKSLFIEKMHIDHHLFLPFCNPECVSHYY